MKKISNSVRRPCVNCGFSVRVNEGKLYGKNPSGEWTVTHFDGECPSTEPIPVEEKDTIELLNDKVERVTPKNGARSYQIDKHGTYPSVTTILSTLSHFDKSPGFEYWKATEIAHTAINQMNLYENDYREWKEVVRNATNEIVAEAATFGTIVHDVIMDIVDHRIEEQKNEKIAALDIDSIIESHVRENEHMRSRYISNVKNHVDQFIKWEKEWVKTWYGSELILWNETEGWAGQGDAYALIAKGEFKNGKWRPTNNFVPTMIDWKTSKFKDMKYRDEPHKLTKESYRLQVAAYGRSEYTFNTKGEVVKFSDRKPIKQGIVAHINIDKMEVECIDHLDFEKYGEIFILLKEVFQIGLKVKKLTNF